MSLSVGFRREFLIIGRPVKIGGDVGEIFECFKLALGELDNMPPGQLLAHGQSVCPEIHSCITVIFNGCATRIFKTCNT